jgi:ornithine cyclodeaminase/alanine dehydrogenase-like protein (mu-crystallin family)
MRPFRYVGNADVKRLLTPSDAVAVAEQTLRDHAAGEIDWADPRQLDLWPELAVTRYKVKGCLLRRPGVAGFRVTGLNRTEAGKAASALRPTKHIMLSDVTNGEFFGIVDERWAYGLRTGSGAAVALRHLRAPGADEVTILGTGHMAHGAAHAIAAAIPLRSIRIWSPTPERREAFAARLAEELGVTVTAASTAREAVTDAPMVVTATEAPEPFLKTAWFAPGVTIYALGRLQEFELDAYRTFTFMADDTEQIRVCAEIKRFIIDEGYTDGWVRTQLADVVGGLHPGRVSDDERIMMRSQGLVTMDVAQALWVYEEAVRRGLGLDLEPAVEEREGDPLF